MDMRLRGILEAFLKIMKALNDEMTHLNDTNQFTDHAQCLRLVEDIRGGCMDMLKTLSVIERRINASGLLPPGE